MKRLTLLILILAWVPALFADGREQNPLQLQWLTPSNWGPNATAYDQGAALGYHFNPQWYFGVSGRGRAEGESAMGWMMGSERMMFQQEGLDQSTYTREPTQTVELRWTPWDFGLYFSAGGLSLGAQSEHYVYDKRARILGDNAYTTDLDIQIDREAGSGAALGAGYVWVSESGFSLSAGSLIAVDQRQKTITITTPNADSTVSEADLAHLKDDVSWRENMFPMSTFSLGVGWNF
ncbi:MAG: hypothetical protein RRB13_06110 [bacterium]|nr:hypothetical protein [bacterium]